MDAGWTRAMRAVAGVLVGLAMVAGFVVVVTFIGRGGDVAEAPLYLEPTEQTGQNPFVPAAAVSPQAGSRPGGAQPAPDSPGSGQLGRCDPAQLIAYLTTHRSAAEAWVAALNSDATLMWSGGRQVSVEQIPDYINELSSVTLTEDR